MTVIVAKLNRRMTLKTAALGLTAASAALSGVAVRYADADPLITFSNPENIEFNRSSNASTIGVTFTATSAQLVTALGVQAITYNTSDPLDRNTADFATLSSLPNNDQIAELRDAATGNVLASETITSSNSTAGAGGYFYTALTAPIALVPGVTYTIDAYDPTSASGPIHYLDTNGSSSTGVAETGFTLNGAYGTDVLSQGGSGGDVAPTGTESSGYLRYAPANALIGTSSLPEPASLSLLAVGGLGLLARRRRA